MRKQSVFLILIALVFAAAYVYFFTDLFKKKHIQILFTNRNSAGFFGLDGKSYNLTSVKVVRSDENATNKYAHAVWHLIAETNTAPVSEFAYGRPIPGMKPKIPGTVAEPLQPNVDYHIIVEAGKIKGERDFRLR